MGFGVDGAVGRADGRTPRALLWVHLEEVEGPKQVLRAPPLWTKLVANDELTDHFDDADGRPEELMEEPELGRCPDPVI